MEIASSERGAVKEIEWGAFTVYFEKSGKEDKHIIKTTDGKYYELNKNEKLVYIRNADGSNARLDVRLEDGQTISFEDWQKDNPPITVH